MFVSTSLLLGKAWRGSWLRRDGASNDFECPRCGETLSVPETLAGEGQRCPTCGRVCRVPGAAAPQAGPRRPGRELPA